MKLISILIFVSIVCIHQICGHKIHKRQLDISNKELNTKVLLNATNLEAPKSPKTTTTLGERLPEQTTIAVNSMTQNWSLIPLTEAPEILSHPFVEETDQSNESDLKDEENLQTENPQELNDTNSSKPAETMSILNIISKPVQIVKEDCTCFSIHHPSPNTLKTTQKFENSTTSISSEIESEYGVLFEFAPAGVLPKVNETLNNKTSQEIALNEETTFFEEFIPFISFQSLFSKIMPQDTIIIQAESSGVEPLKLDPKSGADSIKNVTDPIKIQENTTSTQKSNETEKFNEKKTILA
ncbi:uncharacterized protein LOC129947010 [Eupeodes corollae]|uniref:uncharacterized protein LOC129947010 n=1 Tax=Eupeodes corollae TaxID=290404 RepID=UPI002492CF29|nr:uncharacterized protein LOC129947010 [Eupeodes corollae]